MGSGRVVAFTLLGVAPRATETKAWPASLPDGCRVGPDSCHSSRGDSRGAAWLRALQASVSAEDLGKWCRVISGTSGLSGGHSWPEGGQEAGQEVPSIGLIRTWGPAVPERAASDSALSHWQVALVASQRRPVSLPMARPSFLQSEAPCFAPWVHQLQSFYGKPDSAQDCHPHAHLAAQEPQPARARGPESRSPTRGQGRRGHSSTERS